MMQFLVKVFYKKCRYEGVRHFLGSIYIDVLWYALLRPR